MNREDIIRLAREAGMAEPTEFLYNNYWTAGQSELERFAELVAKAEREASFLRGYAAAVSARREQMNREEVIRLAKEAGLQPYYDAQSLAIERFAKLAAAAERKACIKIIEAYQIPVGKSAAGEMARDWTVDALKYIRDEIRARGESK
jgi:hypothetical protein